MTQINPYIIFDGNCREAMTFYQSCLGGELVFQTIGESPMAHVMLPEKKDSILHATLTNQAILLMGSDKADAHLYIQGNAISLTLNCNSEEELKIYFEKLSADGKVAHPLENTFMGAMYGALIDKFGNHWLLRYLSAS